MDPYILFPYWFTLLLLVLNAIAVRYIRIDMEDQTEAKESND